MKKFTLLYVLAFTLAALPCFAQQPAAQPAAKKADNAATSDKILYSLGYLLGNNLKEQLVLNGDDDFKAISQGLRDSLLNRNSQTDLETYKDIIENKCTEEEMNFIIMTFLEEDLDNFNKAKQTFNKYLSENE